MDLLLAKTNGKKGSFYNVLINTEIFSPEDLSDTHEYDDQYKLEEDEWFVVKGFSSKTYCLNILKAPIVSTGQDYLQKQNYENISFIMFAHATDNNETFYFQKITPSSFFSRQKMLSWDTLKRPTDMAIYREYKRLLVIKQHPDAIYVKNNNEDNLYFKRLSSITGIFDGINELYQEATNEEVDLFRQLSIIKFDDSFTNENIKTANRKRIKQALDKYNSFDDNQKQKLPDYIKNFYPELFEAESKTFKIENEMQLTEFLNGVNQRLYIMPIDDVKCVANSISKLSM